MVAFRYLTEEDKRSICEWHYEEMYSIYNLPTLEKMKERKMGFYNPERERNFLGVWNKETLIGYVNLREDEKEAFIGIGVRPELCGYGYGCTVLEEACKIAKERYPEKSLYLEVRCWNKRAIRCYEKAGFKIDGKAFLKTTQNGSDWFYRMTRE